MGQLGIARLVTTLKSTMLLNVSRFFPLNIDDNGKIELKYPVFHLSSNFLINSMLNESLGNENHLNIYIFDRESNLLPSSAFLVKYCLSHHDGLNIVLVASIYLNYHLVTYL